MPRLLQSIFGRLQHLVSRCNSSCAPAATPATSAAQPASEPSSGTTSALPSGSQTPGPSGAGGAPWTWTARASAVQIYKEQVTDLLGARPVECEVGDQGRLYVKGNKGYKLAQDVRSAPEVLALMRQAAAGRVTSSTRNNDESSRSHAVFALEVTVSQPQRDGTCLETTGTLRLVDLAGSENLADNQGTKTATQETISINKSLTQLGIVMRELSSGKNRGAVAYRNSKLTHMLKDALGGNSRTVLIVNVHSDAGKLEHIARSLQFAADVKDIRNTVVANRVTTGKAEQVVAKLREELQEAQFKLNLHQNLHDEEVAEKLAEARQQQAAELVEREAGWQLQLAAARAAHAAEVAGLQTQHAAALAEQAAAWQQRLQAAEAAAAEARADQVAAQATLAGQAAQHEAELARLQARWQQQLGEAQLQLAGAQQQAADAQQQLAEARQQATDAQQQAADAQQHQLAEAQRQAVDAQQQLAEAQCQAAEAQQQAAEAQQQAAEAQQQAAEAQQQAADQKQRAAAAQLQAAAEQQQAAEAQQQAAAQRLLATEAQQTAAAAADRHVQERSQWATAAGHAEAALRQLQQELARVDAAAARERADLQQQLAAACEGGAQQAADQAAAEQLAAAQREQQEMQQQLLGLAEQKVQLQEQVEELTHELAQLRGGGGVAGGAGVGEGMGVDLAAEQLQAGLRLGSGSPPVRQAGGGLTQLQAQRPHQHQQQSPAAAAEKGDWYWVVVKDRAAAVQAAAELEEEVVRWVGARSGLHLTPAALTINHMTRQLEGAALREPGSSRRIAWRLYSPWRGKSKLKADLIIDCAALMADERAAAVAAQGPGGAPAVASRRGMGGGWSSAEVIDLCTPPVPAASPARVPAVRAGGGSGESAEVELTQLQQQQQAQRGLLTPPRAGSATEGAAAAATPGSSGGGGAARAGSSWWAGRAAAAAAPGSTPPAAGARAVSSPALGSTGKLYVSVCNGWARVPVCSDEHPLSDQRERPGSSCSVGSGAGSGGARFSLRHQPSPVSATDPGGRPTPENPFVRFTPAEGPPDARRRLETSLGPAPAQRLPQALEKLVGRSASLGGLLMQAHKQ